MPDSSEPLPPVTTAVPDPGPQRPEIADPLLPQLISQFGTPLVVHDLAVLRDRAARLRGALPEAATLLYSLKANPLPPVVAELARAGCGREVSSPGELATALAAGAGPVFYTGPGKTDAELRGAPAAGALLSCESVTEVARLAGLRAAAAPGPLGVVLRVQPPARPRAGLSMSDGRQFGLLPQEAVELCRRPPDGVRVVGFHCYLGSQLPGVAELLEAFGQVVTLVDELCDAGGVHPEVVDLGGGFPWPYAGPGTGPELAGLREATTALVAPWLADGVAVWFESGRALVAAAGRLVATVMDVKEREGATLVVLDAGVNVLGGMSGLGRVLRPSTVLRNLTGPERALRTVDVVGPLCTPLDRLAVGTAVPEPRVGDVLVVDNVGAYASTAALSAFLSRPAAVEVVVDGPRLVEAWTLPTRHVRLELPGG